MNAKKLLIITAGIAIAMMTGTAANAVIVGQNLGASAYSASSSYCAQWAPPKAFDGDYTYVPWHTGDPDPTPGKTQWNAGQSNGWIEVNLGQVYDISGMVLLRHPMAPTAANQDIWISSTGPIGGARAGATKIWSVDQSTATDFTLTFAPGTMAQYVQVQTSYDAGWTNWMDIYISASPVPEPSSLLALSAGLLPLLCLRRRKKA